MTDNNCGATKRDGSGEECQLPAGWGTDHTGEGKCKLHGGATDSGGAPEGNDNGKKHGAFSEHFRSDLTDDEEGALEDIVAHLQSIDDERSIAAEVAAEALMKYKRSADSRFLREARQWFSEFNLMENAENVNVEGAGIVIQTNADE